MIVWRRTFNVKQGCMAQAVAMVKESYEMWGQAMGGFPYEERSRLYVSRAHRDVLIHDTEVESLAKNEEMGAAYQETPEIRAYLEKWRTITERGATAEWLDLQ